jgi:hypothetical protein
MWNLDFRASESPNSLILQGYRRNIPCDCMEKAPNFYINGIFLPALNLAMNILTHLEKRENDSIYRNYLKLTRILRQKSGFAAFINIYTTSNNIKII